MAINAKNPLACRCSVQLSFFSSSFWTATILSFLSILLAVSAYDKPLSALIFFTFISSLLFGHFADPAWWFPSQSRHFGCSSFPSHSSVVLFISAPYSDSTTNGSNMSILRQQRNLTGALSMALPCNTRSQGAFSLIIPLQKSNPEKYCPPCAFSESSQSSYFTNTCDILKWNVFTNSGTLLITLFLPFAPGGKHSTVFMSKFPNLQGFLSVSLTHAWSAHSVYSWLIEHLQQTSRPHVDT